MTLQYAVIQKADAWALFRGEVELVSFPGFEQASKVGRSVALAMSSRGAPVQLLLQDSFGELRPEWFAFGRSYQPPGGLSRADAAAGMPTPATDADAPLTFRV